MSEETSEIFITMTMPQPEESCGNCRYCKPQTMLTTCSVCYADPKSVLIANDRPICRFFKPRLKENK